MCNQDGSFDPARRRFLDQGAAGLGLAVGGLLAATAMPSSPAMAQDSASTAEPLSPDAAQRRLIEGNERYIANAGQNTDFSAGRAARAAAQHPFAAVLSCADSRLAPEIAFDQGLGDLFVVRVAGNFVNEDGLASLEFGAEVLGIPLILVLGHSGCGAVAATIGVIQDGIELPGSLPGLVNNLKPGVEIAIANEPEDLLAEATIENVRYNVRKVEQSDPIMARLVGEGRLKVIGGVYDIATGAVTLV
ncbi:carbonic anhydrase [Aquibaculum sediminis]|uniref:carbonic anhydrase n=1 Tax=Aquibaculum sediminis TaxID=3231907 RepID=UPI0034533AA2